MITNVPGAKEAMIEMGWKEEGECLVLPAGKSVTMREVREIDDARAVRGGNIHKKTFVII